MHFIVGQSESPQSGSLIRQPLIVFITILTSLTAKYCSSRSTLLTNKARPQAKPMAKNSDSALLKLVPCWIELQVSSVSIVLYGTYACALTGRGVSAPVSVYSDGNAVGLVFISK